MSTDFPIMTDNGPIHACSISLTKLRSLFLFTSPTSPRQITPHQQLYHPLFVKHIVMFINIYYNSILQPQNHLSIIG